MALFIGAISGTSVDSLDLAVIDSDRLDEILYFESVEFPRELRSDLLTLNRPGADEIRRMGLTHAKLGQFIGSAINGFIDKFDLDSKQVIAIGSHGQTIRHHTDADPAFTVQIGDGNRIAEQTGIQTITNFRDRDIAAGGEGAPLVPIYHDVLFRCGKHSRVIVNIGGIANITLLPAAQEKPVSGHDTGPGNALLDAWIQHHKGVSYDPDGSWGRKGSLHKPLLNALLDDEWFDRPPPKSTGKELFNLDYIRSALNRSASNSIDTEDVQATLVDFTAKTIADAVQETKAREVIICGGGRHNQHVLRRLRARLANSTVVVCEELGIDGDSIEAAAFAYLAYCLVTSKPGNLPSVTGARGPRLLGVIHPA